MVGNSCVRQDTVGSWASIDFGRIKHVGFQYGEQVGEILTISSMDCQLERFGQIQAEQPHDGFCVDDISVGRHIHRVIEFHNIVYKGLDLLNGCKGNWQCLHVFHHASAAAGDHKWRRAGFRKIFLAPFRIKIISSELI